MAIKHVGGGNPAPGKVNTTLGMREPRPMLCMVCGQRKDGLFTYNANGQAVCQDCMSPRDKDALRGVCDDECDCESCSDES